MADWPKVRLGEVLSRSAKTVLIQPDVDYREITVRLWGKGVVLRGIASGAKIAGNRRFIAKKGQFIISRIDARNGAMGLVPPELDGAVVTNDFPLFDISVARIEPAFFGWLSKTGNFVELCQRASEGTTNRVRLQENRFLALEVSLPPLAEQQRIVARIEELAAQIQEAQSLRCGAIVDAEALPCSVSARIFEPKKDWIIMAVREFCDSPQYGYTESATAKPIGPRFLRITDIQNGQVNWERVPFCRCPDPAKYLLKPGDLVFARTGATTGKSFLIYDCPEAVFASYLIRLRVQDAVSIDYLYRYFQSPSYWEQIADEKKGTGQSNLRAIALCQIIHVSQPLIIITFTVRYL